MFTEVDRDAVLARALALLSSDERVEAVLLTGSLGRGQGDRWSDVDLSSIVTNDADVESVTADWEAVTYREWPVAHHYATEFGTTRVRGFLLRNALLLDMGFTPVADLEVWAPVKVLLDRSGRATRIADSWTQWSPTPDWRGEAGFAAHDVLHACVAANRGRRWQSVYFLQRIRNRTLALASERHGFDSDDFTRVDDLPADETSPLEATLVAELGPANVLDAIDRATRAFLGELRRHDEALANRLAEPLVAIITASRTSASAAGNPSADPTEHGNPNLTGE